MLIKKPIAKLNPKEMTLGVEPKRKITKTKTMAEKKAAVLFLTKQLNAIKVLRNKIPFGSNKNLVSQAKRDHYENVIELLDQELLILRVKYKMSAK